MNYIKDKLSLKINLHMSGGKETSGVVSDKVINEIIKSFTGYGHYEIIWDKRQSLPISLNRLNDGVDVRFTGSQYVILYNGGYNRVLFPAQYIEFDISEYRNKVLNEILR